MKGFYGGKRLQAEGVMKTRNLVLLAYNLTMLGIRRIINVDKVLANAPVWPICCYPAISRRATEAAIIRRTTYTMHWRLCDDRPGGC